MKKEEIEFLLRDERFSTIYFGYLLESLKEQVDIPYGNIRFLVTFTEESLKIQYKFKLRGQWKVASYEFSFDGFAEAAQVIFEEMEAV